MSDVEKVGLEQPMSIAEAFPLSKEQQALLAALTPPTELMAKWQNEFEVTAEAAINSQLSPACHQTMKVVADKLRWLWFGSANSGELPESLAMYRTSNGKLFV